MIGFSQSIKWRNFMKLVMDERKYDGKLIVFCGLDGCGKTTLIKKTCEYLSNMSCDVLLTKQPTPEMRKNHIFRVYQDQENKENFDYRALSLMAASDRLQHNKSVIIPALDQGKTVVSDRYFYSCFANLQARGYENDLWIYDIAKRIPLPNLSIFLDIDVDEAIRRVRKRPDEKDRYIDVELQYRLRESYLKIARAVGGIVIPTNNTADISFEVVRNHIDKLLDESR